MIRDVTHNMKETKQGTMALVKCAVELYTTAQMLGKSIKDYYKISIARKDTVNAHGVKTGLHERLYTMARQRIMDELGIDNMFLADNTNLARRIDTEAEATK